MLRDHDMIPQVTPDAVMPEIVMLQGQCVSFYFGDLLGAV